jgi:hypothetical protein
MSTVPSLALPLTVYRRLSATDRARIDTVSFGLVSCGCVDILDTFNQRLFTADALLYRDVDGLRPEAAFVLSVAAAACDDAADFGWRAPWRRQVILAALDAAYPVEAD